MVKRSTKVYLLSLGSYVCCFVAGMQYFQKETFWTMVAIIGSLVLFSMTMVEMAFPEIVKK